MVTLPIRFLYFPGCHHTHSPSPPIKLPAERHERREKQKTSGLQHGVIWQRSLAGKTKTCDSVTSSGKLLTPSSVERKAVPIVLPMPQTKGQPLAPNTHTATTFFQTKEEKRICFPLASLDILPFKRSKANQSHACLSFGPEEEVFQRSLGGFGWLGAPGHKTKGSLSGPQCPALYQNLTGAW